jgi:hypothetical protein
MNIKKSASLLKKWMNAVNKKDIEKLILLYYKKAVLIPTFSNRILKNPGDIKEYFLRLIKLENLSVELHKKTLTIQEINKDVYNLSGIYCWRFSLDGELLSFEARFSYIINLMLPNPIVQHHSSQIPRAI